MVLGQSSATAAVHAIEERVDIQKIDPKKLEARLLKDGQVLDFESDPLPPRAVGGKNARPPGIVVDDGEAQLRGFDRTSTSHNVFVEHGYRHDGNTDKGAQTARFVADLPKAGRYQVFIAYPVNPNRASNVPVVIRHADGEAKVTLNEKQQPKVNDLLEPVGTFRFEKGKAGYVEISNAGTDGYVVIDAVQWVEVK
jgi:hypothetical protein